MEQLQFHMALAMLMKSTSEFFFFVLEVIKFTSINVNVKIRYRINQLMRHYCAEASIYGDKTQPAIQSFPKIIVILNPVADRKSAVDTVCFENNTIQ